MYRGNSLAILVLSIFASVKGDASTNDPHVFYLALENTSNCLTLSPSLTNLGKFIVHDDIACSEWEQQRWLYIKLENESAPNDQAKSYKIVSALHTDHCLRLQSTSIFGITKCKSDDTNQIFSKPDFTMNSTIPATFTAYETYTSRLFILPASGFGNALETTCIHQKYSASESNARVSQSGSIMNQYGYGEGDRVSWQCIYGYEMPEGTTERVATCLANGRWTSPNAPSCLRIKCVHPFVIQSGIQLEPVSSQIFADMYLINDQLLNLVAKIMKRPVLTKPL